jgi:hypothetical protein
VWKGVTTSTLFGVDEAGSLTGGSSTRLAQCAFFETRATNSSNLERKSFRIGDWLDFL